MNPPTLKSASYDGSRILVFWTVPSNPGITLSGFMLKAVSSDGGAPYTQFVPGALSSAGNIPLPQPLDSTKSYTIQVCAQASGQPDACSSQLVLITSRPTLAGVDYDGTSVVVDWTPVSVTSPTVDSYTATLIPVGGGTPLTTTVPATQASRATLPLSTPLDTTRNYQVQVCAQTSYGVSACTTPADINVQLPAVTQALYDGASLFLGWLPPLGTQVPLTGYTLQVLSSDGTVPVNVTVTGPTVTNKKLLLPVPLDPRLRHQVRVSADAAGAIRVSTPPSALLTDLPVLLDADYDGTRLLAHWKPPLYPAPAVTGYTLSVFSSSGGTPITRTFNDPYASSGQLDAPAFDPNGAYQAQVTANTGSVAAASSPPVPVLTRTPTLAKAGYDGSRVSVEWTFSAGSTTPAKSFRLQVTPTSGGPGFVGVVEDPLATQGTVEVPGGLERAKTYAVQVSAVASDVPDVTGSTPLATLLTAQPVLDGASYDGTQVLTRWRPPMGTGVSITGYDVQVFSPGGGPSYQASFGPGQTLGPVPVSTPLDPSARYQVQVRALAAGGLSAATAPEPLLTALPRLRDARLDGAQVTARWLPSSGDSRQVTGYQLKAFSTQGGDVPTVTFSNAAVTEGQVSLPSGTTLPYQVQVCALSGKVSACGTALALLQSAPTVQSVHYDGDAVTAVWSQVSGATESLLGVLRAGVLVAEQRATGETWSLPVKLAPQQGYRVRVRALQGAVTGPTSAEADILSAIPDIQQLTTGATGVTVTLDTSSAAGAPGVAGYQASLYQGNVLVAGPTAATTSGGVTTAVLTYAFKPATGYSVRVRATGTNPAQVTGPLSPPASVITLTPDGLRTDYDGTTVTASWQPVPGGAVTGYHLTLVETTGGSTVGERFTSSTHASIPVSLVLGKDYAARVSALGDAAEGLPSEASNPLAHSVGYFFVPRTTSAYAYVFRGDIRGPGPNAITLYLPDLFTSAQTEVTEEPFVLKALAQPPPGLPYQLTITQGGAINVWAFTGDGIRAPLQQACIAFLKKLEAVQGGLRPGALDLVRQAIARALPLTFAETLYYAHGFDADAGYADLLPGMRLRIDFEGYQLVSAGSAFNGYAGTGSSFVEVGSLTPSGAQLPLGFNAFLSRMAVPAVPPNAGGAGGIIDLQGSDSQLPYFRVLYPPSFPSSDSGGALGPSQNAVLLGASSFTVLEAATTQYVQSGTFDGLTGIVFTTFRGRAALIPEVSCFLQGALTWVPVGTTVRQLLERFTRLPFAQAVTLRGLDYHRAIADVVDAPAQVTPDTPLRRDNRVHFDFATLDLYTYPSGLDCFSLPVLLGDSLTSSA